MTSAIKVVKGRPGKKKVANIVTEHESPPVVQGNPVKVNSTKKMSPKSSPPRTVSARSGKGGGATPGPRLPSPKSGGTQRAARESSLPEHVGPLIAEWVVGAVIICATVPLEKTQTGYQATMTTIMVRLTALTGVFFALALVSDIMATRKFVVYFGLLVDLGIVYRAVNTGALKKITGLFSGGQPIVPQGSTLAADYKTPSTAQTPTGMI